MPGLVLKYSQRLSQPVVDRLKKRFDALYAGPENAGRTLILDEGADVTVAGSHDGAAAVRGGAEGRGAADLRRGRAGDARDPRVRARATTRRRSGSWPTCGPGRRGGRRARRWSTCSRTVPSAVHLWYDVADIAALREGELERSQAMLVRAQAVGAFRHRRVHAGVARSPPWTSGDLSQLEADPRAMPPGVRRETATPDGTSGPGAAAGRGAAGPARGGGEEPAEREAAARSADAAGTERSARG